jgi:hypothetical protein
MLLLQVCAFVSGKCLSVLLLTQCPTRRRRKNPANAHMQEKRRLARSCQHRASLMEEELLRLSPMRRRLQRSSSQNHRICRHLLQSSARFASWALGISSQPNLRCSRQWSAPQVLHPPKTGCPWIITTRHSLQHHEKTRSLSPAVSMMQGTTATAIPDLLPYPRSFTTGASILQGPRTARLRQHPPVLGRQSRLFRWLHAAETGQGEEHGLCLATAQPVVKGL